MTHYVYTCDDGTIGVQIFPVPTDLSNYVTINEPYTGQDYSNKKIEDDALVDKTAQEILNSRIVPVYTPKEFIERFTLGELRTIYGHAATNTDVRIWLDRLTGAGFVVPSDQALKDGMAYMVFEGLITQARHDEIMDY